MALITKKMQFGVGVCVCVCVRSGKWCPRTVQEPSEGSWSISLHTHRQQTRSPAELSPPPGCAPPLSPKGTHRGSGGRWGRCSQSPGPHAGWGWSFLNPVTWRREQEFSSSSGITETTPGGKVVATLVPKTALALSSGRHGHPRVPAAGQPAPQWRFSRV